MHFFFIKKLIFAIKKIIVFINGNVLKIFWVYVTISLTVTYHALPNYALPNYALPKLRLTQITPYQITPYQITPFFDFLDLLFEV
jgi:hypothetical protein